MRGLALLATLALTSCGSVNAYVAERSMVGMPLPDVLACAGIPAHAMQIDKTSKHDEWLVQYNYVSPTTAALTIKLPEETEIEVGSGSNGNCNVAFRISKPGYLTATHYNGAASQIIGAPEACGPLIQACVLRPDHTTLPADYDFDAVLKPLAAGGK